MFCKCSRKGSSEAFLINIVCDLSFKFGILNAVCGFCKARNISKIFFSSPQGKLRQTKLLFSMFFRIKFSFTKYALAVSEILGVGVDFLPCSEGNILTSSQSVDLNAQAETPILKGIQFLACTKGQLISECLFGVFNFFQKTNENKST